MNRRRAFAALSDGLHGVLAKDADWMSLLEAANQALVTPSLHDALKRSGAAGAIPPDAAAFMAMIELRNDERNQRLREMALAAVAGLNAAGVVPIYLKGMAVWAAGDPAGRRCPRMMSDVDLLIAPDEADRAIEALVAAGFKLAERSPPGLHVVAEFWRDGDVGVLDLHGRPPGPEPLTARFDREAHTAPSPWPGSARAPTPAHQIYLTGLHDALHVGGFWRGGFDVRHLCDIAELAGSPAGIDWDALDAILPTRLVRHAVHSQLVAAHRIAGAPIPPRLARAVRPNLHYRRHVAQYLHPKAMRVLGLLGLALEGPNLRPHWPALVSEQSTFAAFVWWLRHGRADPNRL